MFKLFSEIMANNLQMEIDDAIDNNDTRNTRYNKRLNKVLISASIFLLILAMIIIVNLVINILPEESRLRKMVMDIVEKVSYNAVAKFSQHKANFNLSDLNNTNTRVYYL